MLSVEHFMSAAVGAGSNKLRSASLGVLRLLALCFVAASISSAAAAVTIDFWHPWPHAERTTRLLAEEYTRQTGVTVRVRSFSPASYSPWKNPPDIVGVYNPTKRGIEDLARAGRVFNLEAEMSRGWYTRFWPGMLETFRIRRQGTAGVFGVPLTGQVHMFVYNKSAFSRAGISSPPQTWAQLMSASQRLRAIGVIPYAGGFGSTRPPLAYSYEWSYLGLHNLSQTYFGRYSYAADPWVRNLSIYPEMRRNGFTNAEWAAMSQASAIKALIDGRVAMVFAGPNFESIRSAHNPRFTAWGLFGAPVDSRARFLPRLPGGPVEAVVINRRSKRVPEALRFAKWLTAPNQQVRFANGASSIPATPSVASSRQLQQHLRMFASGMRDQAVDMRVYERPAVLELYYGAVRSLLAGSKTPATVAAGVQRTKRR